MLILGIETSCDETSCAVVENGRRILSNIIASQVASHSAYGGVVPELASRLHIRNIIPILKQALKEANLHLSQIDAVAVTSGPGLVGSLLVGTELAKAIAWSLEKPLVPVQHIAAHLYSPFLEEKGKPSTSPDFDYPFLGLVVSGGHSSLILAQSPLSYKVIGRTLDDAAGEAFDKVAKFLGLGYPGGPIIDNLSRQGDARYAAFPRPGLRDDNCDLSFSGLKTAVVRFVKDKMKGSVALSETDTKNIATSFQAAVIDTLLQKTERALKETGVSRLAIVGGVACNKGLREEAVKRFPHIALHIPSPILCTDNAAMIAGLAFHLVQSGRFAPLTLNADVNLPIE